MISFNSARNAMAENKFHKLGSPQKRKYYRLKQISLFSEISKYELKHGYYNFRQTDYWQASGRWKWNNKQGWF